LKLLNTSFREKKLERTLSLILKEEQTKVMTVLHLEATWEDSDSSSSSNLENLLQPRTMLMTMMKVRKPLKRKLKSLRQRLVSDKLFFLERYSC
jgi:hypothetical protein